MVNTYDLFITRISHGSLPLPLNIHKNILSFVEKEYHSENNISSVNGFQYHKNFSGKEELHTILNNYFKNIFQLELQHGWLNVLEKNSYNRPHFHSGTNINFSGVYYLSNNNNNINLTKDGETFEIKPKLFEYLIFPHHLIHYVLPEDRNEKRICYAFNLERVI